MTPPEPELSVVIPFANQPSNLAGCLAALDRARAGSRVEALVVDRVGTALLAQEAHSSWVEVLPVPPETTIPEMRHLAFRQARGPVVAVVEDHVEVPPDWVAVLRREFQAGAEVVAGGVENLATTSLVDWAAFLCEYAPLLPPIDPGPPSMIPGNNVAYRRSLLQRYSAVLAEGRWEDRLHEALRRDGVRMTLLPEVTAGHRMHYDIRNYTSQRYLFSRSWAGLRLRGASLAHRFGAGMARLALPPLLFGRVTSTVWRKRRHRRELLRSLPLLAWFTLVWAVGEAVGCWAGPGTATARVR